MAWIDVTGTDYWLPGNEFGTPHFIFTSGEWVYNNGGGLPPTGPHTAQLSWIGDSGSPPPYADGNFTHARVTLDVNNDKTGSPYMDVYTTSSSSVSEQIGDPPNPKIVTFDLGSAFLTLHSIQIPINYGLSDYEYFDITKIELFAVSGIPDPFWADENNPDYEEVFITE